MDKRDQATDKRVPEQTPMGIKERRERIGVSQEELAEEAGVSYRTVLRLEKGNRIKDKMFSNIVAALKKLEKSRQSQKRQSLWWLSRKQAGTGAINRT